MNKVYLHPEIEFGREPNRARVWLLTKGQLLGHPKLAQSVRNNITSETYSSDNIHFDRLTRLLLETYPPEDEYGRKQDSPQRGDLVYIESDMTIRYTKDIGKYLFDGTKIRTISRLWSGVALVPRSFEVIAEFPIDYWEGRLEDYLVYFEISRYFPDITERDIKIKSGFSTFSFEIDGELYSVFYKGSPKEFARIIRNINPSDPYFDPLTQYFKPLNAYSMQYVD